MKTPVTKQALLEEIIDLAKEKQVEISEDTTLADAHLGKASLEWMFDWLKEKFPSIQPLTEERMANLNMSSTMSNLADLAMSLIPEGATYEVKENIPSTDKEAEVKNVDFILRNPNDDSRWSGELSKADFLKKCAEFFDARGTHLNDFQEMHVRIR